MEDGVTHLYYCTNVDSRVVTDHIGYRSSTDGVHYSDETIVLANGKKWDAWDATHVCDPDVVKGEFKLGRRSLQLPDGLSGMSDREQSGQ